MMFLLERQQLLEGGRREGFRFCALRVLSRMEWSQSPPIGKYGGGMLDDITELRTFVRIVAAGSLSASRDMGLALSVVSKRLATLERREVRLITRSLAVTEEGQHLFER